MLLIYENAFGEAVQQRLAKVANIEAIRLRDAARQLPEAAADNFAAIVTGRPYPSLHRKVAKHLTNSGQVFTSVGIDEKFLSFGPVIQPNAEPCYECTYKRNLSLLEHARPSDFERTIRHVFDKNVDIEIEGFLPTHVSLAVTKILSHAKAPADFVGKMSTISFVDSRTIDTQIIPVHGCPSCFSHEGDDVRQVSYLQPMLEGIL